MSKSDSPYVFISYSHDDAGFAATLSSRLHRAGIPHFHDIEVIEWGESIPDRVHAALEKATHLIVLISPGSDNSQWVAYEMGYAKGRNVTLVPYLLHPRMKVPGFLSNIRYLNSRSDEKKFIARLQSKVIDSNRATRKTSRITSDSKTEVKDALKKIRSNHPAVQEDGIDVLVQTKSNEQLMALIGHRDAHVRSAAAVGLARLRNKDALKYLIAGLRTTSRRSRNPVIAGVESLFVHYKGAALDEMLSRIPDSFDYTVRNRWTAALSNAVTKETVHRLLKTATESGRQVFLQAAFQSGLDLLKRDLEPVITSYVKKNHDSTNCHREIAQWIADSANPHAKWKQCLVRRWLFADINSYGPRAYTWPTQDLARSALAIKAVTTEELTKICQSITNQNLREGIAKVAK